MRSSSGMGKWCIDRGRGAQVFYVLEHVGGQPFVVAAVIIVENGAEAGNLTVRHCL